MGGQIVIYRLPAALFPVVFELNGSTWRIETHLVQGGGFWMCQLEGPSRWHVAHEANEERLEAALRETGVEIGARTFVGTVFRQLEKCGVEERIQGEKIT